MPNEIGRGWWLASDGEMYPPERHPDFVSSAVGASVESVHAEQSGIVRSYCERCGAYRYPGSNFCGGCGTQVEREVICATDVNFDQEVMQRSMTMPVVVQLSAAWSVACQRLDPILENIVAETGGRVALARIDVDDNPQCGAAFRIQHVPAVFGIRGQTLVASFAGEQDVAKIRDFVSCLLHGSPLQTGPERGSLSQSPAVHPEAESHRPAPKVKLVKIGRPGLGNAPHYEQRAFNREVQKMSRKGYRYVESKQDWAGLTLIFEKE